MNKGLLPLLLLLASLTGCAAFPGDELPDAPVPPPVATAAKPRVLVEFNFYRGATDDADAPSIAVVREGLKPTLRDTLERSGLFEHITLVPEPGRPDDALLRLKLYNSASYAAAIASGMISGLTFFIIPAAAKDDYVLTAEWLPPAKGAPWRQRNQASVRTWIGLWFVPLAASHPVQTAVETAFSRQLNDILRQLQASGALDHRSSAGGNGPQADPVTP